MGCRTRGCCGTRWRARVVASTLRSRRRREREKDESEREDGRRGGSRRIHLERFGRRGRRGVFSSEGVRALRRGHVGAPGVARLWRQRLAQTPRAPGVRGGASAPGRHARGRFARKHPRVATSVRVRAATHRGGGRRGGDDARDAATRALVDEIRKSLRLHGWAEEMDDCDAGLGAPRSETLASIAATAAAEGAVVFNVVHGGCGEDGSLQTLLASAGATFTGSRAAASRLCIDKAATGAALAPLASDGILSCRKRVVPAEELAEIFASDDPAAASRRAWDAWALAVGDARAGLCVKPNSDGCSTGVARLRGPADLLAYADAIVTGRERMRARDLPLSSGDGGGWIELPRPAPARFLVEPFVSTLAARVRRDESGREDLVFDGEEVQDDGTKRRKRLIEVTVAVVGERGRLTALDPSLTIVSGGTSCRSRKNFRAARGSTSPRRPRPWSQQKRSPPRSDARRARGRCAGSGGIREGGRVSGRGRGRGDHHRGEHRAGDDPFHGAVPPGAGDGSTDGARRFPRARGVPSVGPSG